jgi:membrane associated rhomboid family serine protease
VATIVALIVIVGIVCHALVPDHEARAIRIVSTLAARVIAYARSECAAAWATIRQPPAPRITIALAAIQLLVFVSIVFSRGPASDPATLIGWGASVGPLTSNGQWWRLATSALVHGGFFTLVVNTVALAEVGVLVERMAGGLALAATYGSAAVLSSVVNLWGHPLTVASGAAGAVAALHGFLLALILADRKAGPEAAVPIAALVQMLPVAAIVLLFNLVNADIGIAAQAVGGIVGIVFGFIVVVDVRRGQSSRHRTAAAVGIALAAAIAAAIPLRGIIDVRPEIQRLIELEQQTMRTYQTAHDAHAPRAADVRGLTDVIEQHIVPAFTSAETRFKAIRGVPRDDQWLVDDALKYLTLRAQSWSLRAQGLREVGAPVRPATDARGVTAAITSGEAALRYQSSLVKLGRAEAAERTALQMLERIKA